MSNTPPPSAHESSRPRSLLAISAFVAAAAMAAASCSGTSLDDAGQELQQTLTDFGLGEVDSDTVRCLRDTGVVSADANGPTEAADWPTGLNSDFVTAAASCATPDQQTALVAHWTSTAGVQECEAGAWNTYTSYVGVAALSDAAETVRNDFGAACSWLDKQGLIMQAAIESATGIVSTGDEIDCLLDTKIGFAGLTTYFAQSRESGEGGPQLAECLSAVTPALEGTVRQLSGSGAIDPWGEALCLADDGVNAGDINNVTLNLSYPLATLAAMETCLSPESRRSVARAIVGTFTEFDDLRYDLACSDDATEDFFDTFGYEVYVERTFVPELLGYLSDAGCVETAVTTGEDRGLPQDGLGEFVTVMFGELSTNSQLQCFYDTAEPVWPEFDITLEEVINDTLDDAKSESLAELFNNAYAICFE